MKSKLKTLDPRVLYGSIVLALVLIFAAGYLLVVSPESSKVSKLKQAIAAEQSSQVERRAQLKSSLRQPAIETADIYRLERAMPNTEDMPGILLALSQVGQQSGIAFTEITPEAAPTSTTASGYQSERIHLLLTGDFYALSDFLYRLRTMVTVRNGTLDATGRLFNVDAVTLNVGANDFPSISADVYVDAYVYGVPAATAAPTSTTDTSTTDTSTTSSDTTLPDTASAAGATP